MDSDMEVIWSAKAKFTYFMVLDYLNENWTKKEMIQFNQRIQIAINAITKNPYIFPCSTNVPWWQKNFSEWTQP